MKRILFILLALLLLGGCLKRKVDIEPIVERVEDAAIGSLIDQLTESMLGKKVDPLMGLTQEEFDNLSLEELQKLAEKTEANTKVSDMSAPSGGIEVDADKFYNADASAATSTAVTADDIVDAVLSDRDTTIDADGDITAKSYTAAKVSGTAGRMGVDEANSTDTTKTGWEGAASIPVALWFKFANAEPLAGQMMVFSAPSTNVSQISWVSFPVSIGVAASDETTDLTTGAAKVTFRSPFAFTLTEVRSNVNTAPTGATLTVDVNEGGTTVFSTELTIDATETTSTTAATPAVIDDPDIADDAEMTIDIEQIGSSAAGKGLKIWLIGTRIL